MLPDGLDWKLCNEVKDGPDDPVMMDSQPRASARREKGAMLEMIDDAYEIEIEN